MIDNYLAQHADRLLVFDEIHRLPGIFATLRSLIDQRRRKGKRNGQFLLLGSASIDLLQQSAETLAGRIAYEELTPFSVAEVAASGVGTCDQLWNRGIDIRPTHAAPGDWLSLAQRASDGCNLLDLASAHGRCSRLDLVHPSPFESKRDCELLVEREGDPWRLFAIPQG